MPEKDVRNELAAWLFEGADVQKTVSDLSGGEKARLVLAEILEKRPNFLMLDELQIIWIFRPEKPWNLL